MDDYSEMARLSMSSVGSSSGHYDPQNDVIMRGETLGEQPMKYIVVRPYTLRSGNLERRAAVRRAYMAPMALPVSAMPIPSCNC